ncbi:glycosyltransferase [Proteus terrae]|uniref:glycosyltransferase n=1 Tax=Proteus terrae TaxID=1574161 RepID=UPI0035239AEF
MSLKFSVLMSIYDKEEESNLLQCLDSLAKQLVKPTETVIVYDGPIRKSLCDIISKYTSTLNIKKIKLDKNVGLGEALNIGLTYCENNIVARMDTDDIAIPSRFKVQINYFLEHPDLTLIGSNINEFEISPDQIVSIRKVPNTHDNIRKYALYKCPFNHMTVMFKKNAIIDAGSYVHHHYMEDYNLWLRIIANNHKVLNIEQPLVYARVNRNTLLRRRGFAYIKSEYKLAKLKNTLKLQSKTSALLIFILRAGPRLLPPFILKLIYKINRDQK